MEFQQSKTFSNLQRAFESELIITAKFLIYGFKARQDGYIQIGNFFDKIAQFDLEFAKIWLKQTNNGVLPDTLTNLIDASNLTNYQGMERYQEYSRVALEEGFSSIASLFNGVANIQMNHEFKFRQFSEEIISNTVFCKPTPILWICLNCGNILSGDCAPKICPICGYPQGFYREYNENCY